MVEVCIIAFSRQRDKKSFVLATVHKDEMENMIPAKRSTPLTSMKTKRQSLYRVGIIKEPNNAD